MPGGGHGRGQEGLLRFRWLASVLQNASSHFARLSRQRSVPCRPQWVGGRSHRYLTASPSIPTIRAARPWAATQSTTKPQRDDGLEQLLLVLLRGQRRAPQAQGEEAPQEGKKTPPQGGEES